MLKQRIHIFFLFFLLLLLPSSRANAAAQQLPASPVEQYGMLPIYGRDVRDGTYEIEVTSSSSMFRIIHAELTVEEDRMEAVLTLSGTGYLKLFLGTGQKAMASDETAFIGFEEDAEGKYTYRIPVEALNKGLNCAAFSKRKEKWYDRVILFKASSLPEDALLLELPDYDAIEAAMKAWQKEQGLASSNQQETESQSPSQYEIESQSSSQNETASQSSPNQQITQTSPGSSQERPIPVSLAQADGEYAIEVSLLGGSGKSGIVSPTLLTVRDQKAYANIQWSSSNYDYMLVGNEKYLNTAPEGSNSLFEIPVTALDEEIPVIADTTAMGTPHEVSYTLTFYADTIGPKSRMPQEAAKRVVLMALVIIIAGGILNHFLKKRHR